MAQQDHILRLATDDQFQRGEWIAQRVRWGLWVAILVAAGVGLLGPGWLSARRLAADDGAFTLNYDRFLHHHHPSQLEVSFKSRPRVAGEWTIHIGQAWLDGVQILRIEPEPVRQRIDAAGAAYTFAGALDAVAGKAVFHVEHQRYGEIQGAIALDGGEPVRFSQFVYP